MGGLEIVVSHDIDAVSLNLLSRQHFEKVKNLQTISIDNKIITQSLFVTNTSDIHFVMKCCIHLGLCPL